MKREARDRKINSCRWNKKNITMEAIDWICGLKSVDTHKELKRMSSHTANTIGSRSPKEVRLLTVNDQ